mmetsp:Transcript_78201/g.153521  ORF Transcript_78201/g.153521 Transcript_78201/m.153521 type:complete len:82 (-) Transcript_78201:9-254(-)
MEVLKYPLCFGLSIWQKTASLHSIFTSYHLLTELWLEGCCSGGCRIVDCVNCSRPIAVLFICLVYGVWLGFGFVGINNLQF